MSFGETTDVNLTLRTIALANATTTRASTKTATNINRLTGRTLCGASSIDNLSATRPSCPNGVALSA
jgi:hypothetical protein